MNKNKFSKLVNLTVGQVSWTRPPWLDAINRRAQGKPVASLSVFVAFLILLIGMRYAFIWYQTRPQPQLITASITVPGITPIRDEELVPDVLAIDFGYKDNAPDSNYFAPQSVAPLNKINQEVSKGITLTPTIKGQWIWQSDSRLVFTPEEDWPAGQSFNIHFDKSVFASQIKMKSHTYAFSTQPFVAKISEFKIYQDPVNPKHRQAVATLRFNFPVDPGSLENHLSLLLEALKEEQGQHYEFNLTYDKFKRTAYLHSVFLPIPKLSRYLRLNIDKNVKAAKGEGMTTQDVTETVLLPDSDNYFKVVSVNASIVRDPQDRPEQVLIVNTTLGVSDEEIKKYLHVYLLPQHAPTTKVEEEVKDMEWINPGQIDAKILALSEPLALKTIPAAHHYDSLHSFKFISKTPRYLYLKIDKGVLSQGGFALTRDYTAVIKVPEFPKEINFLHKGALLALSGEKKLSVLVRGVPAVKFEFARLLPENINQLITQTQGDFNNPIFINKSFNEQNISMIFSEIQQFDTSDLSKQQYTALDFTKYLTASQQTKGPQGLFLLQAKGWDVEKQEVLETQAKRLVLITDEGLIVKDNQDGSHDVFVQSITQGIPLANVNVSVLGKNGLPILSKITDAQGRVTFPNLSDYVEDREPVVYLAKLGNDVSFIPYNNANRQLNYSRYDIGGLYTNTQEQHTLSAYVFSDRGIYRPSDTVHVGMIVKQAYAQPQPLGLSLEATITDPRGVIVQDKQFTLDALGYLSFDFLTQADSPTGQYQINLYLVKDKHKDSILGSTTIQVAEFQPDRMRIQSTFSQSPSKGWISPQDLSAKVQLWNLYGAPAMDRKVKARLVLEPKRVAFEAYPDYIFADPLFDTTKPTKFITDTLAVETTNSQGEAVFKLNLDRFNKATYQLSFFAEGFEAQGGRSVTTQSTALVSPLAYFVGYKSDGELNFIKQNSQRQIHFIAVNAQLMPQAVSDLSLQLIALHPVSTLVKKPDGTYQYQSIIESKIIRSQPFVLSDKSTSFTLPTQDIGDFALSILDKNNTELSQLKFSIVGTSQASLEKNAELNVKLNKTDYAPGEEIELQITAPYTGAGLITIERDKIYAAQWFKSESAHSIQKIRIPSELQGNGYINVTFVRDWNSPDIFTSPLSYSVSPFTLSPEKNAVHIKLSTVDLAQPGEPLKIEYQTDKPGKIIVFAVDEGILQVAHYETPDPLAFFFQKRALEVLTQQTVDQILPKYIQARELSAVGGDGGEALLNAHLNPFKRKTDLPVVYWSGLLDTDATTHQLTYEVPNYFNGTLHVMAVAVALDSVGAADKKTEIRAPLVISPNAPTFVAPKDEFEVTASIANNVKDSGVNAPVSIELNATDGLEIIGPRSQSVNINEGQEASLRFKVRATDQLGAASVTLTATLGQQSNKMDAPLSIRPASQFYTSTYSGMSEQEKTLSITRSLYPEYRQVEAAISSSPLILVNGLQRYLDNFPYGCTEQLTSKVFPLLAFKNQLGSGQNNELIRKKIMDTIQLLGQRQMSNGGFSYWPGVGQNEGNEFASVYAMHFLTDARERDYRGPDEMFNSGIAYLKEVAAKNVSNEDEARIQAYAIYVLTRNEIITSNYLTHLQLYLEKEQTQTWKHSLTGAYIAATYQLLKDTNTANRFIDLYQPNASSPNTSDFYSSAIANAQYLYLIARHFPEQMAGLSNQFILQLVSAINSTEMNSLLSAYTSLALNAYAQGENPTLSNEFSISEVGGDSLKILSHTPADQEKLSISPLAKQIIFHTPHRQTYFYQLSETGFDKDLPTKVIKQNLEVSREYRDNKGSVIERTHLGEEIEVHIQVRALKNEYFNQTAIVDLLPGGFEVVRESVSLKNCDYADIREDRVIFYGDVDPSIKEIVYRIKAVNEGNYTVPPIFAEAMYDPSVQAQSLAGKIEIIK